MAKNKKITKKERKAEAKQRRLEELRRRARRQQMRRVYTIVGVAVVLGGIVAAILAGGASGRSAAKRLNTLAAAAGCDDLQSPKLEGNEHVAVGTTVPYGTDPPTSGNHYSSANPPAPTPTGIYSTPIRNEVEVHNLEHGHIGIQYVPAVSASIRTALEGVVRVGDNTRWVFMAPRDSITGAQVAFTAWGRLLKCPSPKDGPSVAAVAREFIKQFRDKGRENIPGTPLTTTSTLPPTPAPTTGATPRATTTPRATASPS
jgi:hypothetical protein